MTIIMVLGLLAIMAATAMPLLGFTDISVFGLPLWNCLFALGAAALLILRIAAPGKATDLRTKRLYRLEFWSAVIFCVAAFFIFYMPRTTDWLAFTLAGAFLQAYASIMLSRRH